MNLSSSMYVLITGATGGIGRVLVEEFTKSGYQVIATDIVEQPNDLKCAFYIQADLAKTVEDEEYANQIFSSIQTYLDNQTLSILINNAAVQILGSVEKLSRLDWQKTLNTNLLAPFIWTQAFLGDLEKNKGNVINISSIHAHLSKKNFVAYATSKAALSSLTRNMAIDLGGKVRINAIEPAAIETDMLKAGFEEKPELYQQLKRYHPQNRVGKPLEVAKLALALISNDMHFLHGAVIKLDGGISGCLHDPD